MRPVSYTWDNAMVEGRRRLRARCGRSNGNGYHAMGSRTGGARRSHATVREPDDDRAHRDENL